MINLKKYSFIFSLFVLVILLSSLILPWITINILGNYSSSSLDIIKSAIDNNIPQNQYNLFNLFSQYNNSYFAFISSIIFYVISMIIIILSFAYKKYRLKILLIAGILAILSGALWIYSIESFKLNFIQTAISAGGIIGEEWKGQERAVINSILIIGVGHYLVIIAGSIAILIYLWFK